MLNLKSTISSLAMKCALIAILAFGAMAAASPIFGTGGKDAAATVPAASVAALTPRAFNRMWALGAIDGPQKRDLKSVALVAGNGDLMRAEILPREIMLEHAAAAVLQMRTASDAMAHLTLYGSIYADCYRTAAAKVYAMWAGVTPQYSVFFGIKLTQGGHKWLKKYYYHVANFQR